MNFVATTYLQRIGLNDGAIAPTLDGLSRLQIAQASNIVFENMDPLTGKVPDLNPDALWRKLVAGRRGGYCFELNGLFGVALSAFGFEARPLLARVRNGAPMGGARTHHTFVVTIDGVEYLADCGFGNGAPVLPMRLELNREEEIRGETFRLCMDENTGETVLELKTPEGWRGLYGFDGTAVQAIDFEAANFLTARWDKAPFSSNLMMTVPTEDGRNNLFNRSLKIIRQGKAESRMIETFGEFCDAMTTQFALPDNGDLFEEVWAKIEDR